MQNKDYSKNIKTIFFDQNKEFLSQVPTLGPWNLNF